MFELLELEKRQDEKPLFERTEESIKIPKKKVTFGA
jgi:hypothetical protein